MKYYIALVGLFLVFTGCNNRKPDPSMDSSPMMSGFPASSNNSEIAIRELDDSPDLPVHEINYYGTYAGTLPAADGPGIQATLSLYDDNTYLLKFVYLEKEEDTGLEEHGKYYVSGDVLTLQANNQEQYYRITDNSLIMLDAAKQEVKTSPTENYRLEKK
ncbi:MAG: copper resistance protein NlpE N-terminal domain-containing protein [Tannerellaceae bacterium]|nr:copper resistance protein NlpE N-terminal domain-containing protein [Tannerellaceae bacterium]